jgi:hypothetical protein
MPSLHPSLDTVRKDALAELRKRLDAMAAAVDDTLFDRSEKAPAEEQGDYFNAMKDFRLKRQGMVDATLDGVDQAFAALGGPAPEEKKGLGITLDSLSLIGDEELDVSVAFQGMLARCRDIVSTLADHLRQRVALAISREIEAEKVPLHPEVVAEQFKLAVEPMGLPLKARLIIYKMFERHVLEGFRDVLLQANDTLARAGFLPEIQVPRIKHSSSSARGGGGGGGGKKLKLAGTDETDEEVGDDDGEADAAPRRRSRSGGGEGAGLAVAVAELLALMRGGFAAAAGQQGALPPATAGVGNAGNGVAPLTAGSSAVPSLAAASSDAEAAAPAAPISWQQMPAGQLPVMYGNQVIAGGQVVQSDVPVQVVPAQELSALLTQLQRMQFAPSAAPVPAHATQPDAGGRVIEHAPLQAVDVSGGLSELLHETPAEAPRALAGADKEVIDLVSMLFAFILDDAELPAEMKALVGRLQIPLLKVSLIDRDFFEQDEHPARALVNSLARAGIGWTRESDDGLYTRIEAIVHRVLTEFSDDVGIFARLDDEFSAFLAEREKRLTMMEARLRDREEGQAKNSLAQDKVREAIATRITGKALLPEVIAVIQEGWQRVLYLTALREGTDSELWQQRIKVLDVLVWCAAKYEKEDLRARQRGLVPRLLVSLRKAMEAENIDAVAAATLLDALRPALEKLGTGDAVRTVRVVSEQAATGNANANGGAKAAPAGQSVQVLRSSESEVVIAAPATPPPSGPTPEERWLQMADSLVPGTWVEFHDAENNFTVRGKIAARIRAQDKFIFVNGRGAKIAEKSVGQLARDLASGAARLISDSALFDRALETMITRLKSGVTG